MAIIHGALTYILPPVHLVEYKEFSIHILMCVFKLEGNWSFLGGLEGGKWCFPIWVVLRVYTHMGHFTDTGLPIMVHYQFL